MKACRSLKKEMIDHERKFVSRYTEQELRTLISLLRRLHDPADSALTGRSDSRLRARSVV